VLSPDEVDRRIRDMAIDRGIYEVFQKAANGDNKAIKWVLDLIDQR
jgi:hypothetical protein